MTFDMYCQYSPYILYYTVSNIVRAWKAYSKYQQFYDFNTFVVIFGLSRHLLYCNDNLFTTKTWLCTGSQHKNVYFQLRYPLYKRPNKSYPRRVRGHIMGSLLFLGTYSDTWVFTSVLVNLSVSCFPGFVIIMN